MLAFAGFAFCMPARADSGGEDWVTPPRELNATLRAKAKEVMTVRLASGTASTFTTFLDGTAGWTPLKTITLDMFVPVSRQWGYRSDEPVHPLEGAKFAVMAREGEFAEIMYDSRSGATGWFRIADFHPHVVRFGELPRGENLVHLSSAPMPLVLYPFPEASFERLLLTGEGDVRASEQSGDFIRIIRARYNEETHVMETAPLGWFPLHDAAGDLLFWPWYYDDC